jgi:hypothetical protein
MVQEQERSLGLAILAALSLVGWIALYGLLFWYEPLYRRRCPPTNDFCGLGLLGPGYVFTGTGALLGLAAWLGATVRAVRRREVLSALSIGLLLLVALVNAVLVHRHADSSLAFAGAWVLFSVVSATLLATSLTSKQALRRSVAVAGLVLAVALLVATNLVGG